jgi:hypothetical protein
MNIVYAPYCSSDAWSGNRDNNNPTGFHFRGHKIVDAIFNEAIQAHGMGSSANTQVIYGGCSAGARGALFNLDRIGTFLQQTLPSGHLAAYGGLLDSAFWIDMPPLNSSEVPFGTQVQDLYVLANSTSTVSPTCAAMYPGADEWKCLMGEYAVRAIASDYLLFAFQYDLFQLTQDEGVPVPKTPQQLAYAETFRNATRFYAGADTILPARAGTAALLPACFKHCSTEDPSFTTLATDGVTFQDATVSWFFGTKTAPAYVMDNCTGFNCGADCPAP